MSREGSRSSGRAVQLVVFGVAASLFVAAAVYVFGQDHSGAWQAGPVGTPLTDLPVVDAAGTAVSVEHPALIYVYASDCRYCTPMEERLARFFSRHGAPVSLYALAPARDTGRAGAVRQTFQQIQLTRGEPRLSFVQRVPYLVRTDTAGEVIKAYVGLAEPDVLREMSAPASEYRDANGGGIARSRSSNSTGGHRCSRAS